jgi:hypothetical protein
VVAVERRREAVVAALTPWAAAVVPMPSVAAVAL